MRSPSQQHIADKAGVSRSTVSRALRGSPLVPKKLRDRIQKTARQLGYKTDSKLNELMAYLRKGRAQSNTETLGVIVSGDHKEYLRRGGLVLGAKFQGMQKRARQLGFQMEIFHLGDYNYNPARLSKVLWHRGIRGVLVDSLRVQDSYLELDWQLFSAVSSSFCLARPYLHRVCHYYFHSFHQAYQNLWKYGYRRIGICVSHRSDEVSDHNWLSGYFYEGIQHGVKTLKPFVYDSSELNGFAKWINRSRPDVLMVTGSVLPFLKNLQDLGYDVPKDIGLVCLNSSKEGHSNVAGIDQRMELIGQVSVSVLAGLITQNERGIPENPVTHLVEGVWLNGKTLKNRMLVQPA